MLISVVDDIEHNALRPLADFFFANIIEDEHIHVLHLIQINTLTAVELCLQLVQMTAECIEQNRDTVIHQLIGYRSCKVSLARSVTAYKK